VLTSLSFFGKALWAFIVGYIISSAIQVFVVGVFFAALVATAIVMHYGFSLFGILPQSAAASSPQSTERFAIDYTFWLNLAFLVATGVLVWLRFGSGKKQRKQHQQHNNHQEHGRGDGDRHHHCGHNHGGGKGFTENLLFWLAILSYIWLAGGIIVSLFVSSS
jgi:hypothetical protein